MVDVQKDYIEKLSTILIHAGETCRYLSVKSWLLTQTWVVLLLQCGNSCTAFFHSGSRWWSYPLLTSADGFLFWQLELLMAPERKEDCHSRTHV